MSLHRRRVHRDFVEGCFGCRVSTLQFATKPTNDAAAGRYNFQHRFAAEFHNGDREAYRRLRANGVQPPRIAGCADLEKHADTRFEVESGAITDNPGGLRDALAICEDGGFDPMKAAVIPKAPEG